MFLNRLNEITRPKVHRVDMDLGYGDGIEPIYFRSLSFDDRQRIFAARSSDDGSVDMRGAGLHVMAELVSSTLCNEDGSLVVTLEAALKWDNVLIDRLGVEAMKAIIPDAKEDPSQGQS